MGILITVMHHHMHPHHCYESPWLSSSLLCTPMSILITVMHPQGILITVKHPHGHPDHCYAPPWASSSLICTTMGILITVMHPHAIIVKFRVFSYNTSSPLCTEFRATCKAGLTLITAKLIFCKIHPIVVYHINLLAPELFFFILAHPVYKM